MREYDNKSSRGPAFWDFIHISTMNLQDYDDEKVAAMCILHDILPDLIPCDECSEHVAGFIGDAPCNDRDQLVHWRYVKHNEVNERLGKEKIDRDTFTSLYGYDAE